MPVFVIKAQDALAPQAIEAYRRLCVRYELLEQAEQVQLALDEIEAWQAANEDLLRLPRHRHVPVK
jgi:DNA-binding HxlR family transcriptional regulator